MLIPWWAKLIAGAILSSIVLGAGYKIGSWREAANGAEKLQQEQAATTQCKLDLAAQRETDLSGANHALTDAIQEATTLAKADAESMAKLASGMQRSSLDFAANTRALYAIAVGTCSFTPDLVSLLNRAGSEANAANHDDATKTATPEAKRGDDKPPAIPERSH